MAVNKRQVEVQKVQATNEQKVLKELKQVYTQASKDCATKIAELSSRTDMENLQSIIYQKQYQEAMNQQLDATIEQLNSKAFSTVADYITTSYEDGFFGAMYDLQGQGIPLCFPINQEEVVQAVQTNSKISKGLYTKMGEDTDYLKKAIRAELSRGVSNGESWNQIAGHIANGMNSPFQKAYNRTKTIARTEGHRVQQEATLHCQQKAKSKGADVMKQWDSTLDGVTRPTHKALDGQLREVDEPFEGDGGKAMFPGGFGTASEDCNCRCCLLQRARWAISNEEFFTKWDGDKGELVKLKGKSYNEFKEEVKDVIATQEVLKNNPVLKGMIETLSDKLGVEYNPVSAHSKTISEAKIIEALAGGDKTKGSCASVGLAYVGQKNGLDVLDFRGGESQNFFSDGYNLKKIAEFPNLNKISEIARSSVTSGKKLLTHVEEGNEYYFVCGRHASIVRKQDGILQYLEMQSASRSGWTDFNGNVRYTLANRFGETKGRDCEAYMFNVQDAKDSKELQTLLGYINKSGDAQKKGVGGSVK